MEHVEEDRCVRLAAGLHDGQRRGEVRYPAPGEELQADPEAEWRGAAADAADGGRQGVHGHGRTHVVDHVHDRRPEHGGGAEAGGLVGRVEHVGWEACPHAGVEVVGRRRTGERDGEGVDHGDENAGVGQSALERGLGPAGLERLDEGVGPHGDPAEPGMLGGVDERR